MTGGTRVNGSAKRAHISTGTNISAREGNQIMKTEPAQPKTPRTASWRFKSAGHILIWIGAFGALFVTVMLAASGGVNASRFNWPGIVGAGLMLAAAGGCFLASWLTRTESPEYHDVTVVHEELVAAA